jgi:hypothetical protein
MSHDTHNHHQSHNDKPVLEFKTGIFFVLILAGLFLAGIAFAKAMGGDEENGHGGAHHTEAAAHEAGATTHEANKHEEQSTAPAEEGHAHDAAPAEQHH